MAKVNGWLVTIIGILLVLAAAGVVIPYNAWIIAILVLIVGIVKLTMKKK